MKQGFRKIVAAGFLTIALTAAGCSSTPSSQGGENGLDKELNVFNWSEYLPDSVIKKFEERYGVKVNYSTFSSNEEMLAKVSAGGGIYDLTVASDYFIQPMANQGLIEPLDLNNIPNFKNLEPDLVNKEHDPGNKYSVPYMGNTVSLAYNPDNIKTSITSFADLWKPELKSQIVMVDDQRFILGMVLKTLGYSGNDTDPAHLEEAKQKMLQLMPNIKAFDSDSPKTLMINGEVNVALVWGPEIALAQREKPQITTVLPKEGLMITFDNFVIPAGAKHKKTAEAFINFLLEPEISAEIAKDFPYINPNTEARKLIDKETLENIAIYPPPEEMKRVESLKDIGDSVKLYDRIWSEVKSSQ
ncbi:MULTISPECIES: ABC transporter substrate-binding protein [Brevibacillus]|jgi:spermidine/putrescine transport system substrate-binding protein/spermidine/putrescine transport system permease protein|uniref:ABC transporter substrate-binding protein n=1 Tax=Brevibacillus TaxID=55080 RepID=UPI00039D3B56|nr:spermidine/putrescine ABC transporter substrate-binding protein [Brevibacillus borstelensis]KKX55328.1 ABC transporter permease [Brevibacillus borstelensis cifa_chp40]MCM3592739.1 spermidine/putrescine ABC transporter substrate-binding protein [Brevibacillus borstelensis]MED1744018.1 spermidine/putrescine ABC transporter substrate-binding protein [Brevibacillus borstelensis]MED1854885.1 spermidine/putrescine ABC transporter substrate-binding protein [Brevibacillus borstelensis]MED1874008.1 